MIDRPVIPGDSMHLREQKQLSEEGYTVLYDAVAPAMIAELNQRIDELFILEGSSAGAEFKQEAGCRRLANLVNKGLPFQQVVQYPPVLPLVESVLGSDFKLSSLNVRSVEPKSGPRQPLHSDMAAVADRKGFWVCNVLWMLQEVDSQNGPIRVIPGSHRFGKLPQHELADPTDHHPDERLLTGPAGTLVVFNSHLWHGGMENLTESPRRAMHAFYCRRDKPQQQYQKALLDAQVQASISGRLRELLALDDKQNDLLSREVGTTSGFMK